MIKVDCILFWVFLLLLLLSAGGQSFGKGFEYDSHGKRDPFVSAHDLGFGAVKESTVSSLKLEGILKDGEGSNAMISGEIVKVGDEINGFRVHAIETNQVVLERDGETFELILRSDDWLLGQPTETTPAHPGNSAADSAQAMEEELKKLANVTINKENAPNS